MYDLSFVPQTKAEGVDCMKLTDLDPNVVPEIAAPPEGGHEPLDGQGQ